MIHDECCTCACGHCAFWDDKPCEEYVDGKHRASAKMPDGEDFEDRGCGYDLAPRKDGGE